MFFSSILHQLIPISKSNHYKWNQRLPITSAKADHSQPWEHNAATLTACGLWNLETLKYTGN